MPPWDMRPAKENSNFPLPSTLQFIKLLYHFSLHVPNLTVILQMRNGLLIN